MASSADHHNLNAKALMSSTGGGISGFHTTSSSFNGDPLNRSLTSGLNVFMSPKKMSNYHVNKLDESNEIAAKLKKRLQQYLNSGKQGHQT